MMDLSTMGLGLIDYAIFIVALVAVLVVGVISGGKIKDLEDYATSRKQKFSTPVLAMTLIVTMIGSNSSIGAIAEIYKDGFIYLLSAFLFVIGPFLVIQYAAKFLSRRYPTAISLYGIIEQDYGMRAANFSSVITIIIAIITLSMQMIGMGYVVKTFLGLPFYIGVIGSSVVFIIYSSLGGIRGVVYTDVLQFCVVFIVFPILVGIVVYKIGGLKTVFNNLPQEKIIIAEHPRFKEYLYLVLFWAMPFGLLNAAFIQRVLMCESEQEIKKMGLTYVLFKGVFVLMVGLIGLSSISIMSPTVTGKEVVPTLMQSYLPIGFKGFAITAFLAVIMSTADSVLNAATVLVAEIRLSQSERQKQNQKDFELELEGSVKDKKKNESIWLKMTSLIMGSLSMVLALVDFSFIKASTIATAIAFSSVSIPIFFAPFKDRRKVALKAYLGSAIGGFGAFLILWLTLGQEKMYMVSFYATFFAIAGWFIGANFFDKIKTNFWARMWEAYAPKARASKGELIKTTQGG
jgi:SSS family solute:Na+ symporter